MNIDELKQKPVAMMTGEELSFLIDSRMATWATEIASLSQRRIEFTMVLKVSLRYSVAVSQLPIVSRRVV